MRCGPKREVWYRKVQLCAFAIKVAIKMPYAQKKKKLVVLSETTRKSLYLLTMRKIKECLQINVIKPGQK
jgi:hypothetical protein